MNKAELTRFQRRFEACLDEIRALERSRTSAAAMWATVVGLIGTAKSMRYVSRGISC